MHANPELQYDVHRTASIVAEKLKASMTAWSAKILSRSTCRLVERVDLGASDRNRAALSLS